MKAISKRSCFAPTRFICGTLGLLMLASCGGGADDPQYEAQQDAHSLAAANKRYALAAVVTTEISDSLSSNKQKSATVQVFDAAAPAKPRVKSAMTAPSIGVHAVWTSAYTVDRARHAVTFNGYPMVFFVRDGKVYQSDLGPTASHEPKRISSITDACAVLSATALSPDGRDAWIDVGRLWPDGGCNSMIYGYNGLYVRTGMSPTVKAVALNLPVIAIIGGILETVDHRPERGGAPRPGQSTQRVSNIVPEAISMGSSLPMAATFIAWSAAASPSGSHASRAAMWRRCI